MSIVRRFGTVVQRYVYPVLLTACGSLAFFESLRLKSDFDSGDFLSGPGGYLMIVGIVLLCFAAFETLRLARKRRQGDGGVRVAPATEEVGRAASEDEEKSEKTVGHIEADRRRMRLSFMFCAFFVLLIEPMGFTLASLVYLAANLLLLGNGKLVTFVTLCVVFMLLHFGAPAIGLSLPKGLLGL
jgi:hypothetical protein